MRTEDDGGAPAKREPPDEPTDNSRSRLRRLQDQARIAPIQGNPSLDPVTSPWDVARMAGYDGDAYDAMAGVDKMVTGEADAMEEMELETATEGTPLELAADESLLSDDTGEGDLTLDIDPAADPENIDWAAEMRIGSGQGLTLPGGKE